MAITVGQIGAHYGASDHMRGYVQSPHVDSVVLAEPDAGAGEKLYRRWGIIKDFHTDIETLLNDPEITVIDICVPFGERKELIIRALDAGKNVICEQSPGQTAEDFAQVCEIAEHSVGQLFVCIPQLYIPANVKAGELLAAGELGTLRITTTMVIIDEAQRGETAGILTMAYRCIAVLQKWMGPAQSVVMQVSEADGELVSALISLAMSRGGLGEVALSYGATGGDNVRERRMVGSDGALLLRDDPEDEMPLVGFEDGMFFPIRLKHIPFIEQYATVMALEDILRTIVRGDEAPVSNDEALAVLRTCDAALQSSETGLRVIV